MATDLNLKDEQTMFAACMRDHFGIVGQVLAADILAEYAERYAGWLMAKRAALAIAQHCTTCDGTGDVHRADGEWLGECHCAKDHRVALAAGDLMAIAEECGGLRIAENVVQVTKEDLALIVQFVPPAAPALSDEEILRVHEAEGKRILDTAGEFKTMDDVIRNGAIKFGRGIERTLLAKVRP